MMLKKKSSTILLDRAVIVCLLLPPSGGLYGCFFATGKRCREAGLLWNCINGEQFQDVIDSSHVYSLILGKEAHVWAHRLQHLTDLLSYFSWFAASCSGQNEKTHCSNRYVNNLHMN